MCARGSACCAISVVDVLNTYTTSKSYTHFSLGMLLGTTRVAEKLLLRRRHDSCLSFIVRNATTCVRGAPKSAVSTSPPRQGCFALPKDYTMRIVDKHEFLKLPPETLYSEF